MSHYLLPILRSIIVIYSVLIVTHAASQDTLTYTEQAFDPTVSKLPPQYIGHDPTILSNSLAKLLASSNKDEFETTQEFHTRIHKQYSLPILGSLTINDIFAFSSVFVKVTYDADHQVLDATVSDVASSPSDNFALLSKIISTEKRYEGVNTFGVRANIKEVTSHWFYIESNNHRDLGSKFDNRANDKSIYYTYRIRNINPSPAKDLKEHIRILLVCKITKPFIRLTEDIQDATISHPIKLVQYRFYIHTEALELWFYNSSSGEIYGKLHRASQTPPKKGTSRSRGSK